ncbi:MAG: DUF433 domain-containing protein [Caldilineaceae bacterium]|nr:DUF433 domain-containing protein [Caldilineaceae bacterium]
MIQVQRFTPAEAAALVDLSEKEVRKEIEYKVIDGELSSRPIGNGQANVGYASPRLPFAALVYLYLMRRSSLSLRSRERSIIYQRILQSISQDEVPEQIEIVDPFYLRLGDGVAFLDDRVSRFLAWKEKLVSDPEIMGGRETFPNSRLTVRRVGGMLERGVDAREILEDYPYLRPSDLEFARLFVRAYPDTTIASANP